MASESILQKGKALPCEMSVACGVSLMLSPTWWVQCCADGWFSRIGQQKKWETAANLLRRCAWFTYFDQYPSYLTCPLNRIIVSMIWSQPSIYVQKPAPAANDQFPLPLPPPL
eukprot:2891607-Amphidinium_carterae.1